MNETEYKAITGAIREQAFLSAKYSWQSKALRAAEETMLHDLVDDLHFRLQKENPDLDREQFFDDCGVEGG